MVFTDLHQAICDSFLMDVILRLVAECGFNIKNRIYSDLRLSPFCGFELILIGFVHLTG